MSTNRAEYMREYRAKRKLENDPVPRGGKQSGQRLTKFKRAQFIAWDGEGINDENDRIDPNTIRHNFIMFSNSVGGFVSVSGEIPYLPSIVCFRLLLDTANAFPHAIHVIYGGSYDMNHILRDLDREHATELAKEGTTVWQGYWIEFHPRRSLTIKRNGVSITLWDVIGFFQMRFEKAVIEWLGEDYEYLDLIRMGKEKRLSFTMADVVFMREYNNAENIALAATMRNFHAAVTSLGLQLSRWDGAGSLASAVLTKQGFKQHIGNHNRDVEQAARHAYFGGRFELGQYGIHEGKVYGYDINSAYPNVFRSMPSLASGFWQKSSANDSTDTRNYSSFSLYHVRWNLPHIRLGPFPYRDVSGLVLFPETGENWIWGSELKAYLETIPDRPDWQVEVLESWDFISLKPHQDFPFQWVEDFYQQRQNIVNGTSELPYGCQMVLKLGLNSLYGKTAQSLGYKPESMKLPPFHSLLYAGYITATTRAMLWKSAMQAPDNIVMLATDGILSTAELDLDISETKELGKWEKTEYDFVCAIQSGVYFTRKNGVYKFRQRGLDTDDSEGVFLERVRQHWTNPDTTYQKLPVLQSRLIGIKTAVISDDMWKRWGCWYTHNHELVMHPGPQTKRMIDERSIVRDPSIGLVETTPSPNFVYDFTSLISEPYERPWDNESWMLEREELEEIIDGEYA